MEVKLGSGDTCHKSKFLICFYLDLPNTNLVNPCNGKPYVDSWAWCHHKSQKLLGLFMSLILKHSLSVQSIMPPCCIKGGLFFSETSFLHEVLVTSAGLTDGISLKEP